MDGSVFIVIEQEETGEGPPRPDVPIELTIKAIDTTFGEELGETVYLTMQGQGVLIKAPDLDGVSFAQWDFKDTGIEPIQGDVTDSVIAVSIPNNLSTDKPEIEALYVRAITEIEATADAPAGGKTMQTEPDEETLKIKLGDEWYYLHPDYINTASDGKGSIAWSPAPMISEEGPKAAYLTSYTEELRIVPDENNNIRIRKAGSEDDYIEIPANFVYAEDMTATMNGEEASFDREEDCLSYRFPETKYSLVKVFMPEDVTGIPYGTEGSDLTPYLPLITIQLDDGKTMTTVAAWGDPKKSLGQLDEYGMQLWQADGTVELPYGVDNPDDISLNVVGKLLVDAAKGVEKASPSVEPGTYRNDLSVTLASETEGAEIYWTTDPGATDNIKQVKSDPKWYPYDGTAIAINREDATEDEIGPDGQPTGRKLIRLRTSAFKDGMRPDGVRIYTYVFATDVKDKYTISLDLNGGSLDGRTGIIEETYYEGTEITMPLPEREGYTFNYWKGSQYKAGDKYEVKENHTFVAQWDKSSGGDSSGSGDNARTGDSSNILIWLFIINLALLGIIISFILRRRKT